MPTRLQSRRPRIGVRKKKVATPYLFLDPMFMRNMLKADDGTICSLCVFNVGQCR